MPPADPDPARTGPPVAGVHGPGALLPGKVAIVTGAGAGIGRGTTELFGAHGAAVLAVDVDGEAAREVARLVTAAGGRAEALELDVTEAGAGARIVAAALDTFGRIDVVVNNVGHFLFPGRPFVESTPDEWAALGRVNLGHVLEVTHAALPILIDQGTGGSIINVTTVEAFRGIPQHPVYAAYKAAVTQFGRSLAVEVGRHGIRVNDLAPDVTRSRQLPYDRWLDDDDRRRVPTWVPIGRLGEPIDTAGAALFLASDLGAFVTGTTIHCDGGTLAAGGWYPTEHGGRGWTNRPRDP